MREPRPFTLKDTALLVQLLYQFHSRAVQDRDYDKAKRFSFLIMDIDRNSRASLEPEHLKKS